MNSNRIKLIACIAMLLDHIGYLLLPELSFLRYIGRISMPLFAFSIAEGCKYTRSRLRYFLNLILLAVFCQTVYFIEDMLDGRMSAFYLNILFTLSLSVLLCAAALRLISSENSKSLILNIFLLTAALIFVFSGCFYLEKNNVTVDYGIAGVLLPLFAVVFSDRKKQLISFSAGLLFFNIMLCKDMPYIWFSLLSLPLICLYNGKRGDARFKAAFYLFYPLHLAALYLIKILT